MIIAFVGIDGSGKTTLLSLFKKHLEKKNKDVHIIKALDPTSDFMSNYNFIRNKYISTTPENKHDLNIIGSYIMSFDLFQQSEKIKAMNTTNSIILLDRWAICQQLYAKVWMAENNFANTVYSMCLIPDITFVIDSNLDIVEQRLIARGGPNEYENMMCLRRLKRMYIKYANEHGNAILIDNNTSIDVAIQKVIDMYERYIDKT